MGHRRRRELAYFLLNLSIALALVTLCCLSLALYSVRVEDRVEQVEAKMAAYYAAESGLLLVEWKAEKPGFEAPEPGYWFRGDLEKSGSHFKVTVVTEGYSSEGFTVLSSGFTKAEDDKIVLSNFLAHLSLQEDKGWVVDWRSNS